MARNVLVAALLIMLAAGCNSRQDWGDKHPVVVLRDENGFAVISKQRTYYQETGGVVRYGEISFKLNRKTYNNEMVSRALFPENSHCYSPFYTIQDVRLLANNSAIVLMSTTGSSCETGQAYLAKIYPEKNRLKVQRVPIIISGRERGIQNGLFYRHLPDGLNYGYFRHEERLDVQKKQDDQVLIIKTLWKTDEPSHMVALDPGTLTQIDLGEGEINRVVEAGKIALMRERITDDEHAGVRLKAVRVADGKVLEHALYRAECFRPVSEGAKDDAISSFSSLLMSEKMNARYARWARGETENKEALNPDESRTATYWDERSPGREINFESEVLSGMALKASNHAVMDELMEERTLLKWNEAEQRIKVTVSGEIRRTKGCSLDSKS